MRFLNPEPQTLVLHHAALGDLLLLGPMLRALSRPLHLLVGGRFVGVARHLNWCDAAEDLESSAFASLFGNDVEAAHLVLPKAVRVIDAATDGTALRSVCRRRGIRYDQINTKQNESQIHQAAYYLQQIGLPPMLDDYVNSVRVGSTTQEILIHPGSGGVQKCWPVENFIELADRLITQGKHVRVVLGPAELERIEPVQLDAFRSLAETIEWPEIVALAGILAQGCRYIGNDSGISHLAAACGARCTVLFGPTDPAIWRPLGPEVTLIVRNHLLDIAVDDVMATLG